MRKVSDWYNDLKHNASLEFTEEEEKEGEAEPKADEETKEESK
jgi:hypothetical protein